MTMTNPMSRREALKRAVLVTAAAALGTTPATVLAQSRPASSRTLVAYFSRTGNTRVIAGQISRDRGATQFEIAPAVPYPGDYGATVDQAERERDTGYEPPLAAEVPNLSSFDVVYLGFPIWGGTAPPVIRSFLARHDLSGQTLVPFITHGGYGTGTAMAVVRRYAPRARVLDAFVMEADQERRTVNQVNRFLSTIGSTT